MQTEDQKNSLKKIRNAAIICSVITAIFFTVIYSGIKVPQWMPFLNSDHRQTYAGSTLFLSFILWICLWIERSRQKEQKKCTDEYCNCRRK